MIDWLEQNYNNLIVLLKNNKAYKKEEKDEGVNTKLNEKILSEMALESNGK